MKCQLCEPCLDKCHEETNICILHKEKVCSHFNCGHYIPVKSPGLSCEHSADDVPDYPAEKLAPWVQALKSIEHKKQIGASTEHLDRTSLKRCNNEPPLCGAPACKERKTFLQALPIKTGEPSTYELETLSQELGNKWENLARRLGIDSDGKIDAFKNDNTGLANTAFSMLRDWKQTKGKDATYTELHHALCHPLVGCKLLAEEFCYDKSAGNGSL